MANPNPVANSVAMQLSYKQYATSSITPNVEPLPGTDPGATGAQQLRRVSSTLSLDRASFKTTEIIPERQIKDFRHGAKRVLGNIVGELSPKTYQDLMAGALRATWVAGVSKTNTTFTTLAATASASKFTVGASTWAAQLFKVGDVFRPTGIPAPNNGNDYTITALNGVDAVVDPPPADMAAQNAFTVAVPGRKLFAPASLPVPPKYAFEQYYSDVGIAHLFTECRIGSMKIAMPSSGIPTIDFSIMGRNLKEYTGGSAPFFTAPNAPTDTTLTSTFGGSLLIGGVEQAIITSAEITANLSATIVDAAFQDLPPEIYTGTHDVTGQITVLFEDDTLLDYFLNETEIEVILKLTTTDSPSADFISFFMPRVKLNGHRFNNAGQQGIPVTIPFQALKKPVTTGYDASTLIITDSLSA